VKELWAVETQEVSLPSSSPPSTSLSSPLSPLSDSGSFSNRLGSFTRALFQLCEFETVVKARSFLQQEEYEEILQMNRNHLFDFNFQQLKSHDDKWTTRVLATVIEDISTIIPLLSLSLSLPYLSLSLPLPLSLSISLSLSLSLPLSTSLYLSLSLSLSISLPLSLSLSLSLCLSLPLSLSLPLTLSLSLSLGIFST
jgi:hypothetical protein